MANSPESWEARLEALWGGVAAQEPMHFCTRMERLVDELPEGSAIGQFELGSMHDSTGQSNLAVPLYRSALAGGLSGIRRRRATIQLASSLRNIGHAEEAVALLEAELLQPEDVLSGAVRAFLALALASTGNDRQATGQALLALSTYLPRYNASLARYAGELMQNGHMAGEENLGPFT